MPAINPGGALRIVYGTLKLEVNVQEERNIDQSVDKEDSIELRL
jgi:hypothetical protein